MPADSTSSLSTGAWSSSELAETARVAIPLGSDADIPDELRFRAGVAKLIQTQRVQGRGGKGLAVFLLARLPDHSSLTWTRTPMLDNGLTSLGGRIWIVNPPVASGFSIDCETLTDHDVFELVTTTLRLGEVVAIIVDHRVPVPLIRYYSRGLGSPDEYEAISLSGGAPTLSDILAEIEQAYREHLITPEAQTEAGKLWVKSSHWWVAAKAEKIIQFYLKVHLSRAYPLCKIREEQTQTSGRIDLEIEEPLLTHGGGFLRHAILELKVLRSRGATGTAYTDAAIADWVEKGVQQASAYRQERGALASALCCFDLRSADSGEECFGHVRPLATSLQVTLRRWFLYATSAAFRQATTPQAAS